VGILWQIIPIRISVLKLIIFMPFKMDEFLSIVMPFKGTMFLLETLRSCYCYAKVSVGLFARLKHFHFATARKWGANDKLSETGH